jgi:type IV fimbrial biogenesis protein FimT
MMPLRSRGLTLIELMMGVAIAAILLAVAGPGFQQSLSRNRLTTVANEVTAAVQLARSEAVRNNRRVTLCRSADASSCDASASTWGGWIIFVDTDADGTRGVGEPVVKSGTFDAPVVVLASASITALGERITFRGDGTARGTDGQTLLAGALAACVATAQPAENVRDVSLAFGSRTTTRRRNAGGVCSTPSDS